MENIKYKALQNQQVFFLISDFLVAKEWSYLMQLNKTFQSLINIYYKFVLRRSGLLEKNIDPSLIENQNIKYNLLYKYFHNREILYTSLDNPITLENSDQIKVYRNRNQSLLSGQCIKKFTIGQKFCTFLTHLSDLIICKTDEFFNAAKFEFIVKKNVKQYSARAKDLFYLKHTGELCITFFDPDLKIDQMQETVLMWSLLIPVDQMKISYENLILCIKEKVQDRPKYSYLLEKLIKGQQINIDETEFNEYQSKYQESYKNILIYKIQDLTQIDIYKQDRYKIVQGYNQEKFLDSCIGYSHAYILSPDHNVFEVDLTNFGNQGGFDQGHLKIQKIKFFENKTITKLFCGLYHYFAIEREEIPSFDQWDNQQVIKFAKQNQMEEWCNILKYENITGQDLKLMTFDQMKDKLGLDKEHYCKLIYEIGNFKTTSYKNQKLYGWGKNESGQLGLLNQNLVPKQTSVQLPQFQEGEYIKKIVCGWKTSCMITSNGKIYITDSQSKKDKEAEEELKEQPIKESKRKSNKKTQNNKKIKKYSYDEKNSITNFNLRWADITAKFTQLKDQRKYKLFDISISRDNLSVLAVCYDTKDLASIRKAIEGDLPQQNNNIQAKLTPSNEIVNRIKWDPNLDQADFSIVYEDRFLGNLEIPFEELQNSEIKSHRIEQFKYKGTVVWDKEKRKNDFKILFSDN